MPPFANETEAEQVAGLTVETRVDRVAICCGMNAPRQFPLPHLIYVA